jgi:predicted lactoylglutathione lyase
MSEPSAHLSLVTLGVSDLKRSIEFYETLGFQRKATKFDGIGFFQAGACAIAVWPSDQLAEDANAALEGMPQAFRGFTLAWNCHTRSDVDAVLKKVQRMGGLIRKRAQEVFWGGYSGYFADPDGHLWEVAYNPHFSLGEDGQLTLPD